MPAHYLNMKIFELDTNNIMIYPLFDGNIKKVLNVVMSFSLFMIQAKCQASRKLCLIMNTVGKKSLNEVLKLIVLVLEKEKNKFWSLCLTLVFKDPSCF